MNHRWGDPVRHDPNNTDRTCKTCGVVRRTRKEPPQYWNEYHRDGVKLDGRPDCQPLQPMET